MRRLKLVAAVLLCSVQMLSQTNYVPNPSFESHSNCPVAFGQIYYAIPWLDPTNSTSDLWDSCNGGLVGVPGNVAGTQLARSGHAYAGFNAYCPGGNPCPEYIQVILVSPLQTGQTYCLSFYVSLSDTNRLAVDRVGAVLSPNLITCGPPSGCILNYTPHVENPQGNILLNDSEWVCISGLVTANGTEQVLTIGNFYTNSNTTSVVAHPSSPWNGSYYYIDDVSIIEVVSCNAGASTIICPSDSVPLGATAVEEVYYSWSPSAGLSDTSISNPIASPSSTTTYTLTQRQCTSVLTSTVTVTVRTDCDPNFVIIPTLLKSNQYLTVEHLEPNSRMEIYDMRGRIVFTSENYQNDFMGFIIDEAVYAVRFTRPNGEVINQKLCVID